MKINPSARVYLVCIPLVLLTFWDVIFFGASLRVTDLMYGGANGFPIIKMIHIREYMSWWGSFSDNGGAFIQSDPMIGFIKNSIWNIQSPYWNPFSAAGSLGPETLVDLKFSAFTILNGILGATSSAFSISLVIGLFFGTYFTYLIINKFLRLTDLAAAAGCIFYLLNGYSTANIGVNISQNYLFIPIYIFALLKYTEKNNGINFIILVLSISLFLSALFPPTTVISMISVNAIYVGFLINKRVNENITYIKIIELFLGYVAACIVSACLLSVLFLPIIEGLSIMGTLDDYSKRIFNPIYFPNSILSFFTPTHFFELYNAMEDSAVLWSAPGKSNGFNGNTIYHFGLIGIIFITSTFSLKNHKQLPLIISCQVVMLFFLLRLFNPFLVDKIYSNLPIIRNLGAQYLWAGIFIPSIFLVSFGVDAIRNQKRIPWQAFLVLAIGLLSIYYVYNEYGFRDPFINFKKNAIITFIIYEIILFIILLAAYKFNAEKIKTTAMTTLVLLMFAELTIDTKWVHTERVDFFNKPPELTQYLIDNTKLSRTLTLGVGPFTPELGSAFNVQEITSFNQGVLPDYVKYFQDNFRLKDVNQMAYGVSLMNAKDTPELNYINFGALNFLGVKYLIIPKNFINYQKFLSSRGLIPVKESSNSIVYENLTALPRSFTLKDELDGDINKVDFNSLTAKDVVAADIINYENARVNIRGISKVNSILVISDNWHPNWNGKLNGKPVEIIKINQSFRGVRLEPGAYNFEMVYRPKTLFYSILLSLLSLILLVIVFFLRPKCNN